MLYARGLRGRDNVRMKLLRLLHRWLGLLVSLVVIAVALSGGILIFHDLILRTTWPVLARPLQPGQERAYPTVLSHVERQFRGPAIQLIKFPDQEMNAFHLWMHDGSEAFVHPSSGRLITRWTWDETLTGMLFELHAHLLAGESGEQVNGYLGLLLVGFVLSGLILWYPQRQTFRLRFVIPRGMSSAHLIRTHSALGVIFAAGILLFVVTGVTMVFYRPFMAAVTGVLDSTPPMVPSATVKPTDQPVRPWTTILETVSTTFPDGTLVYYIPPRPDNAVMTFRKRMPGEWHPNGRSFILLHPYTGEVLQAIDARRQRLGMRLMEKAYPLHASKVGGPPYTLFALCTSVALIGLGVFGCLSYFFRIVPHRRKR